MGFTLVATEGENFIDREEIVEEMIGTLSYEKSLMGFTLYGKRRVGKTSIFKEVCRRLVKEDVVPIYFSIWNIVEENISGFARELTTELIEAYRPRLGLKERAKELLELPAKYFYRAVRSMEIETRIQDDIVFLLKFGEEKNEGKIEIGGITINSQTRDVIINRQKVDLTAKEFDLLRYLTLHPRQVFTRDQLLDSVWGTSEYIDPGTVTVHIRRLREKIEKDPTSPVLIVTVWGVGYKFVELEELEG